MATWELSNVAAVKSRLRLGHNCIKITEWDAEMHPISSRFFSRQSATTYFCNIRFRHLNPVRILRNDRTAETVIPYGFFGRSVSMIRLEFEPPNLRHSDTMLCQTRHAQAIKCFTKKIPMTPCSTNRNQVNSGSQRHQPHDSCEKHTLISKL